MTPTTVSSTGFQAILDASLDTYAKETGIDLAKHPSADKLQNCHSLEDVLRLLLERETAFKDYRDEHRKLIDCLRPVVQIIHKFSNILGEVAGLVSFGQRIHLLSLNPHGSQQTPFQPTKAIFVGIDVLLSVRLYLHLSHWIS
jgi:hypothetical protein